VVSATSFHVTDEVLTVEQTVSGGYFAAVLCDFIRQRWLAQGETFTFETVMSSRDKVGLLERANAAGYRTYLYYVCTESPLVNRERIAVRVEQGGHDVPAEKIVSRYVRSLAHLPGAIRQSSRAFLFDNSARDHRLVAEFENGKAVILDRDLPAWFVTNVLNVMMK
jgi:predicted ABC-type ATPase